MIYTNYFKTNNLKSILLYIYIYIYIRSRHILKPQPTGLCEERSTMMLPLKFVNDMPYCMAFTLQDSAAVSKRHESNCYYKGTAVLIVLIRKELPNFLVSSMSSLITIPANQSDL